jgi:hypothetical protein
MKKTVQIVTIPLDKKDNAPFFKKDDLVLRKVLGGPNFQAMLKFKIIDENQIASARLQQLLVLSDDEIQEGDIITDKYKVWKWNDDCSLLGRKKVIASYPQIEGTLPISKETVQEWIDAGTPEEGTVDTENICLQTGISCGYPCNGNCDEKAYKEYVYDPQGKLLLEFGKNIELKEIGEKLKDRILFPDALEHAKDYLSKVVKPSIPTDEEILKKSLEHSNNLYNSDDKCKDNILSEHQLWENSLRDYEAGYKQALKDLGYE